MKSHMNVTLMIKTFNNINSLAKLFTKSKLKVCGKSIPNNNQLIRQKIIILEKKSYACDICDKTFSLFITLANHKRVHTSKKQ